MSIDIVEIMRKLHPVMQTTLSKSSPALPARWLEVVAEQVSKLPFKEEGVSFSRVQFAF